MKKVLLLLSLFMMAVVAIPAWAAAKASPASVNVLADGDEDGDDEEDPEPYVEPPFTVYLNIDNADAVYVKVNDNLFSHTSGINEITVDPGDGKIMVYVNDGYLFTRFDDTSVDPVASMLQYNPPTDYPVTIRKTTSTGMDEGDVQLNDGHVYVVETFDTSSVANYTLTVEVDNAALADLAIGTSVDMDSRANRHITLHDGVNTVTYTELDKYLHVSGCDFMHPLQSVTNNGKNVVDDGQINKVYTVLLKGEKTQDSQIVVTTFHEEIDPYSFTVVVDDVDYVRYLTKYPANKMTPLQTGENTITFKDGDYIEISTTCEAFSCKYNGTPVPYDADNRSYTFTPTDGGTLNLQFIDNGPEPPSFTLTVDDASRVSSFENYDQEVDYDVVNGDNKIEIIEEGDRFRLYTVGNVVPFSITLDGTTITPAKKGYFQFAPADGSHVIVLFDEPVVAKNNAVTITVDNPDRITAFTGSYASSSSTISLIAGDNNFELDPEIADLKIEVNPGVTATVTDADGQEYYAEGNRFVIPVTDGMHITVATEEVSLEQVFLLIVEDADDYEGGAMMSLAEREFSLDLGFNEIPFNEEYDQAFLFVTEPMPQAVYLNGELVEPDPEEGYYFIRPADLDIVCVYLTKVPEIRNITFTVHPEVADKFIIARDLIQEVDTTVEGAIPEVDDTYYVIFPIDEEVTLKVFVTRPVTFAARAAGETEEVPFDEDEGAFFLQIDNDMEITVRDADLTNAVEIVGAATAVPEVYNLQGHRLTGADLRSLTPGIYIVNGRKMYLSRQ